MREDVIADALRRYPFRARRANETATEYRGAVIRYLESRDFATAHEVRLDKPQAEWSSADAHSFREHLMRKPRATHDLDESVIGFPLIEDREPLMLASDDTLLTMAQRAVRFCETFRTQNPTKEFRIMVTFLLTTGERLHALPNRDDRILAIKALCRQYPVYGFVLAADIFIHLMDIHPVTREETATKSDAFVVHVGSRTLRRVFTQKYRIERDRAVFEPVTELPADPKAVMEMDDPYADVFVSVPLTHGKPS
jgi:hypothetical protein